MWGCPLVGAPVMSSGRVRYDAGHTVGGRLPSRTGPHARRGLSFDQIGAHGNCSMLPEQAHPRPDSQSATSHAGQVNVTYATLSAPAPRPSASIMGLCWGTKFAERDKAGTITP